MKKILIIEHNDLLAKLMESEVRERLGMEPVRAKTFAETIVMVNRYKSEIFIAIVDLHFSDAPKGVAFEYVISQKISTIVITDECNATVRDYIWSKNNVIDYVVKENNQSVSIAVSIIQRISLNQSIQVLVVDDSTFMRQTILKLLSVHKYLTLEAGDGREALALIEKNPDIKMIITDYEMPNMDGVQLTQNVRKKYNSGEIVVIGISAHDRNVTTAQFIKSGANDFLHKPFLSEEFYCCINQNIQTTEFIQQIQASNKQLINLNNLKNKFLGMASHDLRNPIVSIRGFSELLLSEAVGVLNDEQKEFLSITNDVSNNMLLLLNELLDISVIESGKLTLNIQPGLLSQLIEKSCKLNKVNAEKKEIQLISHIKNVGELPYDEKRISQVLDNLMSNAIKYSEKNTQITVTLEKNNNWAKVSVKDQGQGLSTEDQSKLFGEFQRLSSQPTGGENSTGLGLSIVKKIVELHGGNIGVKSVLGKGSTFYFELPVNSNQQ